MTAINAALTKTQVVDAIRQASSATGADFDYLLATARRESSLNPQAKSTSSSATGLFQFIDSTWLDLMRRHGSEAGFSDLASHIGVSQNNRPSVADGQKKQEILALRHDPELAAFMAGKLTKESQSILEAGLNRPATDEDLYLSHFFGPAAATKFIKLSETAPLTAAATLFPTQAAANRSVFYNTNGTAKTVAQVHHHLTDKISGDTSDSTGFALASGAPADGNLHHSLFSNMRPTISTFSEGLRGAIAPAGSGNFVLSPQVVKALIDLKAPEAAKKEHDKSDAATTASSDDADDNAAALRAAS